MKMLYCPHLMLSYIRSNDGVLRKQICNRLRDLLRCKSLSAFFVFRFSLERKYVLFPFIMFLLFDFAVKSLQNLLGITYDVMVGFDIFIYFGPVYIYLHYLSLTCEAFRIQSHTVGKSASYSDEKVTAVTGHIGCLRSMHSYHSCGQRIPALETASTHNRDCYRRIYFFCKFKKFLMGSASYHTASAY